jgi:hypothetical protein
MASLQAQRPILHRAYRGPEMVLTDLAIFSVEGKSEIIVSPLKVEAGLRFADEFAITFHQHVLFHSTIKTYS